MKDKVYKNIEGKIKSVLLITDGWLVGKAAKNIIDDEEVNDYDIIVPSRENFQNITHILSKLYTLKINSYGGFKIISDTFTLDIWCEELSHFIRNANEVSFVYNYKGNVLLRNEVK